jgi:hypothetical protein
MSSIGTGSPIGRPPGLSGKKDSGSDSSVLTEMRQRFEQVCMVDDENRQSYIQNVRISSSADQWDAEVKKRRGSNRPALTFNLLNAVVKNIIGDYRQNKMAIKVMPAGGPATDDKADIIAGIIRNIEMQSNADQAYTNGLECSSRGNIGYFRVNSEYEANDVFNQKLVISPIHNPLTVYFDPNAKLLTRADAEYCLVTEMISKSEFRRLYPEAEEMGWDIVDVDADDADEWGNDEQIRLCEYFTKERVTERLVAFDNKMVVAIESDDEIEALEQLAIKPVKERQAERINIKWRKCNGSHILEERTFKTKYIPIIPVVGEEVNIEGKTCLRSAVYYAIDAQHSYNYERSTAIENSALSAKAPWKVTLKMIEMFRDQWDVANTTPTPYLIYTPDPAVPQGPERIEPPSPSTAAMQNAQLAAQDVQRTTGVFDAQLGEKSNVISGVGLSEQQSQGQTSTFIFLDNLRAAIEQCGRVLVDWIPYVYDTERVLRTINAEDDIEMETVNQKVENPLLGIAEVLNDITVGEYDVIVTAGKAFASRRAESVDGMLKWAQVFPQQAPLVADQILENMDVPGGDVMAARVKRSLPPQVVNDPDSPEGQQAAAQAQQQQAKMQQMQEQLLQGKMQAEQGKNQASMAKAQADVTKAHAEVTKSQLGIVQAQIDAKSHMVDAEIDAREHGVSVPSQPAQGKQSSGVNVNIVKSPEDLDREGHINEGLTAIAGHLANTHHEQSQHTAVTHQLLSHLVNGQNAMAENLTKGHQAIAQQMAHQNAIAAAPTEAVRDKAGRITGSRKAL